MYIRGWCQSHSLAILGAYLATPKHYLVEASSGQSKEFHFVYTAHISYIPRVYPILCAMRTPRIPSERPKQTHANPPKGVTENKLPSPPTNNPSTL